MAELRSLPTIVAELVKYIAASILRPMSASPYERGRIIACCEQIASGDADTNEFHHLAKAQQTIWQSVCFGHRFLCSMHHVPGVSDLKSDPNSTFVFGTLIFTAIARLNYQIVRVLVREESNMLLSSSRDISYCIRHNITPTAEALAKPVMRYSVFELITALRMVCDVMVIAEYSQELMYYVKLLEFRASQIIYTNGGAEIFDAVDYVQKLPGGGFCCNQKFVVLVWATIYDIRRFVVMARGLMGKDCNIDAPVVTGGEEFDYASLSAIVDVTKRACGSMTAMESSASVLQCLVKLNMRPGDAILYVLDNPGASKSEDGIVSDMLGDAQFATIARRLGITAVTGVTEFLDVPGADFCQEPLTFGLCMFDLLDMRTQNFAGSRWGTLYSYRALDVRGNLAAIKNKCRETPLVCQIGIGGKWQLIYIDKVYMFNSFMFSFLAWLKLLNLDQRRMHSSRGEFYIAYNTDAYRECIEAVRRSGIDVPAPNARERRTQQKLTPAQVTEFIRSGSW